MSETSTICLTVKDPDEFWHLIDELELDYEAKKEYFEHGEYATIELTFDKNLKVVKGQILGKSKLSY